MGMSGKLHCLQRQYEPALHRFESACQLCPPEAARALRSASDEVTRLAKLVRAETTLGQRLLQFAQNAQSDVDAEVLGAAKKARVPGYDRNARNIQGSNAAGQLVDGRM